MATVRMRRYPRDRPEEWSRLVNEKMTEVVRERRGYGSSTDRAGRSPAE